MEIKLRNILEVEWIQLGDMYAVADLDMSREKGEGER